MHRRVAFATAALLALAGCGGSGDSGGNGSATAAKEAETTTTGSTTTAAAAPGQSRESDRSRNAGRNNGAKSQEKAAGPHALPADEREADTPKVEQLVDELIAGMNAHDGSVCTRLFNQHLVPTDERPGAIAACKRGIADQPGGLELVKIESIQFRETGSEVESIVRFLVHQRGRRTTRFAFHLFRTGGGDYKIDRAVPSKQPG